jgi:hypothetical protein
MINGVMSLGYRIDAPLIGRVGIDFLNNPVAGVLDKQDAFFIEKAPEYIKYLLDRCNLLTEMLKSLDIDVESI